MRLSRALKEKRPQHQERHDKSILQHNNARTHITRRVKTYLETLKWEVLPHLPYSPDVAPSDYHLFRSMAHGLAPQHIRSYEEVKKWIDWWTTSKDASIFEMVSDNCQKDGKKYWLATDSTLNHKQVITF